jgi:hypothetical protein
VEVLGFVESEDDGGDHDLVRRFSAGAYGI